MSQQPNDRKPVGESRDSIIKAIALVNVQTEPANLSELAIWLKRWWCRHYTRPYKDPILDTYTLEELLLEYYETLFLDDPKAKDQALAEVRTGIYEDEDESWLKEVMGDGYQSEKEMAQLFPDKSKNEE